MKKLLRVIQTPECGADFDLVMQKVSSTLDTTIKIENTIVLNHLSNEIEISTDDVENYSNQEATFEL